MHTFKKQKSKTFVFIIFSLNIFEQLFCHWNDRRLRRVFLCFYAAILQLTNTKFQTFAYTSRTVRFSYKKRAKTPPRKFSEKSGLIQKRLSVRKKYFTHILKHPFIPTSPLLGAIKFSSFFFFFSLIWYTFLLINHKRSKSNFCAKLLRCKCNFVSRNFWGPLPREPPQNGVTKNQSFERIKLGRRFF